MILHLARVIICCILHPHQHRTDPENVLVVFRPEVPSSGPQPPRPAAVMRINVVFHMTWEVNAVVCFMALLGNLKTTAELDHLRRNNIVRLQITGDCYLFLILHYIELLFILILL